MGQGTARPAYPNRKRAYHQYDLVDLGGRHSRFHDKRGSGCIARSNVGEKWAVKQGEPEALRPFNNDLAPVVNMVMQEGCHGLDRYSFAKHLRFANEANVAPPKHPAAESRTCSRSGAANGFDKFLFSGDVRGQHENGARIDDDSVSWKATQVEFLQDDLFADSATGRDKEHRIRMPRGGRKLLEDYLLPANARSVPGVGATAPNNPWLFR